jgi:hypothetical protein
MKYRSSLLIAILLPLIPGGHLLATDSAPAPVEIRNRWPVGASLLYLAGPGTPLRKGVVVAVLDPEPLIAEIRRLETLLAKAQAEEQKLAHLEEDSNSLELTRKSVKEAEQALKRFAKDAGISEMALQQAVTDTSAVQQQALVQFNAREKLLKEGFIQKPEYEMTGAKLESARLAADLARAKLDRFLSIEKPDHKADLEQKLAQAKEALEKAQNSTSNEQLSDARAHLSKRIASLQAALAADKEHLTNVSIVAPVPCTLRLRSDASAPPIEENSLVGPGELIGQLQPAAP